MTTAQGHMDISDEFLARARYEFDRGDLLQASEKAWGAVAHCIKAISEERGWEHNGHRKLVENAHALIGKSNSEEDNERLILAVNALHQNFYENWLPRDLVLAGINDASQLINVLKGCQNNGAA